MSPDDFHAKTEAIFEDLYETTKNGLRKSFWLGWITGAIVGLIWGWTIAHWILT